MPPDDDVPPVFVDEQQFLPPKIEPAETSRTIIIGAASGAVAGKMSEVTSYAEFEAHSDARAFSNTLSLSLRLFFDNGGKHALVLGLADFSNADGVDALRGHEFNLLCIPTALGDPDVSPALHAAAYDLCVEMRAVYLVDPPASWSSANDPVRAAIDGAHRLLSDGRNAALYFPRVKSCGRRGARVFAERRHCRFYLPQRCGSRRVESARRGGLSAKGCRRPLRFLD